MTRKPYAIPLSGRSIAIAGILLHLVLAGCSENSEGAAGWAGTVDTLANSAVRISNPSAGVWDSTTAWRLEEQWRIGSATASGPELFGQIRGLAVDDLGRLYVLDNQAKEIRIFDSAGEHVRTFGGQGAGPGEFENPNGIQWDQHGRLWVADPGLSRYSVFDTTGTFIETHVRQIGSYGYIWEATFADDGYLYEPTSRRDASGDREPFIIRMDSTAVILDTIPSPIPIFDPLVYGIPAPGGGGFYRMVVGVPFAPRLRSAMDASGILWAGTGESYQITGRSLRGDTLTIIDRDYSPVPVTAAEKEEALDSDFLEEMRTRGGEVDPDRIPANKPAFETFWHDQDGYLWVVPSPENENATRFDLFDPDGRYLGGLNTGADISLNPRPAVSGDALYALILDELGVAYVVKYRIAGRDGV